MTKIKNNPPKKLTIHLIVRSKTQFKINFLDLLEKKIDNGNLEETITNLKRVYEHPEQIKPYHSVAFYTPKNAALFYEKIRELYKEIPDKVASKSDENPYYGG
jgi:hypothetical protein